MQISLNSISLIIVGALLSGCISSGIVGGERTKVNVGFYNIQGKTFEELDRQIALRGPTVSGVGKAIASTNVRMVPDIQFVQNGKECRISKSKVKVVAKVTLPRLQNQNSTHSDLKIAFSNLENYARLHEAVHVSIADTYAQTAEKEIARLPKRGNCVVLEKDAIAKFKSIMALHEEAQQNFDEREKVRLVKLTD